MDKRIIKAHKVAIVVYLAFVIATLVGVVLSLFGISLPSLAKWLGYGAAMTSLVVGVYGLYIIKSNKKSKDSGNVEGSN